MKGFYDFKELIKTIKTKPAPVVIYGAGSLGKIAFYALKKHGIDVVAFNDVDETKWGQKYCGIPVLSFADMASFGPETYLFVATNYLTYVGPLVAEMNFQNVYSCVSLLESTDLDGLGLQGATEEDEIFAHKPLDLPRVLGIHKAAMQTLTNSRLDIKYLDVVITERCSMKCIDCSNLMQYYQNPKHNELGLLFRSMDKIIDAVDHIYEFRVLGGEPFVNKDIYKILDKMVTYDKVDNIVIYTNATILPKPENIPSLQNKKIKIDITNYGELSRNHDPLVNACLNNDIAFVTRPAGMWTDSGRIEYRGPKTEAQLTHMFQNCCVGDIINLLNGKLYRCPFSANAHNLHAIPDNADDVIDLAVDEPMPELRAKIDSLYTRKGKKQYLTACSYCGGRDYTTKMVQAGVQTKTLLPLPNYTDAPVVKN